MATSDRPHEVCTNCGDYTGKAGPGDGSLYTDEGEGPYCEACYRTEQAHERIAALEQRTEPLAVSQSIRTEERLDALERVVAQLDGALSQFECCDVDQAQLISALERTVARLVKESRVGAQGVYVSADDEAYADRILEGAEDQAVLKEVESDGVGHGDADASRGDILGSAGDSTGDNLVVREADTGSKETPTVTDTESDYNRACQDCHDMCMTMAEVLADPKQEECALQAAQNCLKLKIDAEIMFAEQERKRREAATAKMAYNEDGTLYQEYVCGRGVGLPDEPADAEQAEIAEDKWNANVEGAWTVSICASNDGGTCEISNTLRRERDEAREAQKKAEEAAWGVSVVEEIGKWLARIDADVGLGSDPVHCPPMCYGEWAANIVKHVRKQGEDELAKADITKKELRNLLDSKQEHLDAADYRRVELQAEVKRLREALLEVKKAAGQQGPQEPCWKLIAACFTAADALSDSGGE